MDVDMPFSSTESDNLPPIEQNENHDVAESSSNSDTPMNIEDQYSEEEEEVQVELEDDQRDQDDVGVQEYADEELDLREKIRRYAIKHNLTYEAVSDLLKILNELPDVNLPKSYVTLMKTPRQKIASKYVPPGEYLHIGLEEVAKELAKMPGSCQESTRYSISVHVDGVSLSDSSKLDSWTIAASIDELPNIEPFLLGVYVGYKQPSDFDLFLEDFCNDLHNGHTNGFEINDNVKYFFDVKYIVADAPARAKITNTLGHTAK